MNLQTVAENLRNTIEGKEKYLAEMKEAYILATMAEGMALSTAIKFLAINIDELKKILADVEQCMADNKEFSTWAHWQANPDRSGGQFTDEEIRRGDEWR